MDSRETTISLWSRRVMEACWLLALAMIPVYFSLLSDRHFEPDKAVALRSIVMILGGAWIINWLERGQVFRSWPRWRDWWRSPLVAPAIVYVGVFFFTTLTSVLVFTSFFGGYNRLQGFYTNFSYVVVFGAMLAHVRRREQLERIITVIIATTLPTLGYGWVQYQRSDPLPWAGDTAARVASSMGNSIFVAAYLILTLPFMLYRLITSLMATKRADGDGSNSVGLDAAWFVTLGLIPLGQLSLLYATLKLGALLQAPLLGIGHWWIFPMSVIVAGSTLPLISWVTSTRSRTDWRLYLPGGLILLYMLSLVLGGYLTADQCQGQINQTCYNLDMATAERASDFRTWFLLAMAAYFGFYGLVVALPRRSEAVAHAIVQWFSAAIYAGLSLFTVVIIFFTQSRGPQIGMFVSIFVFFTLFLLQGLRSTNFKRIFGAALSAWVVLSLAGAAFLVVLNTDPSSFSGLRQSNRYINRLGNLLETEGGTGLVRVLIWRGDEHTQGAVGLALSDPLRTVIGWGPESMFVAYNPFYPPRLANYESRGASPDRSHQALLDELVTKGAIGLFSHLFLFGSFLIIMLRLLRIPRLINLGLTTLFMLGIGIFFAVFLKSLALGLIAGGVGLLVVGLATWLGYAKPLEASLSFTWQLLIITVLSAVAANFVENLFGIPIVSSLLYTWVIMAVGVLAGAHAGAYQLGTKPAVVAAPVAEEAAESTPAKAGTKRQAAQNARRNPAGRGGRTSSGVTGAAPARILYAVVVPIVLLLVWFLNLDNIFADMRYLQGKQFIDQGQGLDQHLLGFAAIQDAVEHAPNEDLYFLMYGRALMTLATDLSIEQNKLVSENQNAAIAQVLNSRPRPDAELADLPDAEYSVAGLQTVARDFLTKFGPLQVLDYARLALEEAQRLNPQNKDHPANLGRLHSSWFRNTEQSDSEGARMHLDAAIEAYKQAHTVAPQDVELTGQWAMLYLYRQEYDTAIAELTKATTLDPLWSLNFIRLGEAYRRKGDLPNAALAFANALALDPRALSSSGLVDVAELPAERTARVQATFASMQSDPVVFDSFLTGFERAIASKPGDMSYRQIYTQVLSDSQRYDAGLTQAQLALAEMDKMGAVDPTFNTTYADTRTAFEKLVSFFQSQLGQSKP
ncbi:hypothetical protein [Herpetosiphon gulosus]|uniref:Tetratricopeptide repeat protein n=1 Tax=Herpetosiphon gulosus TaxID=1973496 RepID=A0ABP9X3N7_9CHLR